MGSAKAAKPSRLFRPIVAGTASVLLSDLAAEQILGLISAGQLKPGSRLPSERELAQTLRVSRTALREALRILEATGALKASVGRGRFVGERATSSRHPQSDGWLQVHRHEIAELNHVLQLVEPAGLLELPSYLLAQVAAEARAIYVRAMTAVEAGDVELSANLDREFHRCLCRQTPNRLLRELIEGLIDGYRESTAATYAIPTVARRSLDQHLAIILALEAGSREEASDKLRQHEAVAYRLAEGQAFGHQ
jgi:GntR family transcriptional repressor for pyruvate dehydrogenase complex